MSRLAPHKRDLLSLYWAHYWAYLRYLNAGPITEEETHERLGQLDEMWRGMSLGAKKIVDPLFERVEAPFGKWEELKPLRCPNCGWIHYVSPGSSGPPRCFVCMLDVTVVTKDMEIKQKLDDLRREKEKVLDEVLQSRDVRMMNVLVEQVNTEMENLQKLQARMKGAGIE